MVVAALVGGAHAAETNVSEVRTFTVTMPSLTPPLPPSVSLAASSSRTLSTTLTAAATRTATYYEIANIST
eukprot:CAMPEP_0174841782 /NCGR_PEP_ID=MMETSP1114-20130205/9532_1 /TAXON_ID=312471 /ORGANISM="Neobodo designis, Strain CCAP 1951/1" /LENGTH=70 /DNA_ID=CAMNT_0016075979 /DNA_START=77 /DNA_END=285 /DNA_ORIENTATION=+